MFIFTFYNNFKIEQKESNINIKRKNKNKKSRKCLKKEMKGRNTK